MKRAAVLILCAILVFCAFPLSVFAVEITEPKTVVFVKTGGEGDGSSADSPLGNMTDAFIALDRDAECTVVICGRVDMSGFSWKYPMDGKITFTSVYDGVDYRKTKAAAIVTKENSVISLWSDTVFENVKFIIGGNSLLFICRYNSFTFGEGITYTASKGLDGSAMAKAISIVGGHHAGQPDQTPKAPGDADITVLSGSNIIIVPFNRQIKKSVCKNARVVIGGNAHVSKLYVTSVNESDCSHDTVHVTVKDEAKLDLLLVSGDTRSTLKKLTVNWVGGTIARTDIANITKVSNSEMNVPADKVPPLLTRVSLNFKKVNKLSGSMPSAVTSAPETAAPITDAPVIRPIYPATEKPDTTKAPETAPEITETSFTAGSEPAAVQEGGSFPGWVFAVIAAVAVAAVAAAVIAKKRQIK